MNNKQKTVSSMLSVVPIILGLSLLFVSLYALLSALAYNKQQSFAPASLIFHEDENEYQATNLKIPLLLVFTLFFGVGSWCQGLSQSLRSSDNRKAASLVFYVLIVIQFLLLIVGTVGFPFGFVNRALVACGFVMLSGFFLRYSVINPMINTELSK